MDSSLPDSGAAGFLADRFEALWGAGGPPPDVLGFLRAYPEAGPREVLAALKVDQRLRWAAGEGLLAERYLRAFPDLAIEPDTLAELARGELDARRAGGELLDSREFFAEFPRLLGAEPGGPGEAPAAAAWGIARAPGDALLSTPDETARVSSASQATRDGREAATDADLLDGSFLTVPTPPASKLESAEALIGAERFVLHRRLGTGGMGVVYQAYDRERGEVVAIKTMRRGDAAALYRFKQEFRALADLTHPNLVSLHELIALEGLWLFTMELIEGRDIVAYVRAGLRAGADGDVEATRYGRTRDAIRQLAQGVEALHASGRLHRDIKPNNVLVTDAGRVVLLDFGLAAELGQSEASRHHEEPIVGTIAYMSPEQAAGATLSPASDWYAVGVVLYEALTGRLPFHGPSLETLREKQCAEPRPPSALVSGIPEDLDALCVDLLRRLPENRPHGREVICRVSGERAATPSGRPASGAGSSHGVTLIGRARHLEALNAAYARVKEGRPGVVLVSGLSGSGKSTLVHAFLTEVARADDAVVLAGRCYERESVPFKALDSVIDALSRYLRKLSPARIRWLLPEDVGLLARMFPVLQRVEAVAAGPRRAAEVPDKQELRRRGLEALRELLGRLASYRTLVLAIDDLQWAVPENAALLADLFRPPDPPACLLIGTYRSEGTEDNLFLRALLRATAEPGWLATRRELNVGALSLSEAREMALALLGQDDPVTRAQAHLIALESRGSPFFVDELVKHVQVGGGLATIGTAAGELDLDEVLWARVARLPEEARRLLEVVAVSGRPIGPFEAFQAAELGADGRSMLGVLRAARLIRGTGRSHREEVETYHDRIRESVVSHLSPEVVAEAHLRLALTLEASGRGDPEVLGDHFLGAGHRERAGEWYVKAAGRATEVLAFNHAAELYRRAGGLLRPDAALASGLPMKLGDALANAGRGAEAARAYLEASGQCRGAQSLELRRRAAMQLLISGRLDEGLSTLGTALEAMGMRLPSTPRRALASLLWHRVWLTLRGPGFRTRDVSQNTPEDLTRIDVCWSAVAGLSIIDPIRGADFQARGLLLALKAGEPYRVARALAMEGAHAASGGGPGRLRARRLLNTAGALADRVGHPHGLGMVAMARAFAALMLGSWREAREAFDRAEAIFRGQCAAVAWELDMAHQLSLLAVVNMGDLLELRSRWSSLLKEARQRGDVYAVTTLNTYYSAILRLADDDPGAAARELQEVMDRCPSRGFYVPHSTALRTQLQIDLYRGKGQEAWERVTAGWTDYRRSLLLRLQLVRIQMHDLRARSALAAAYEAPERAGALLRSAERDARRLSAERRPWASALSVFLQAGVALGRGQVPRALELLARAEAAFEAADMRLNAMVARRRRGEVLGGIEGVSLTLEADRWMASQKIRDPGRIAEMLAPGYTPGLSPRRRLESPQTTTLH